LDIFELLSLQHKDARQRALEQNRQQIRELREQEALSARQRLEELQAIEDERQMRLRQRFTEQRRHDRRLLALALGGTGIFLIIVIIFVLFSTIQ
jgi:CHASE3 domain sensor protein